jgi:hypothetical protein
MEKTPTQILKEVNDLKTEHEKVKQEIVSETVKLEEKLKPKYERLDIIETQYVQLMELLIQLQQ